MAPVVNDKRCIRFKYDYFKTYAFMIKAIVSTHDNDNPCSRPSITYIPIVSAVLSQHKSYILVLKCFFIYSNSKSSTYHVQ